MIKRTYISYNIGRKSLNSLIDAVHAAPPNSDINTGKIVKSIITKIDASGIVAIISRNIMDLNRPINLNNRPGILEYRDTIRKILISKDLILKSNCLKRRFLHIAIHGMDKTRQTDFEIGTRMGESCSYDIRDWFCDNLKTISTNIGIDNIFPGDTSKAFHRNGDPENGYIGYSQNFNTIQFEIGYFWRNQKIDLIVDFLCNVISSFDYKFNKIA
jgi:hypothetical protein